MGVRPAVLRVVLAIGAAAVLASANATADAGRAKPRPGPRITPPANVTVEATSPRGAIVVFRTAKAANAIKITYSKKSGSWFPLGTTVVTITAKDRAGRVAKATFKVRVVDTTPPKLDQPADVRAEATSVAGASVSYTKPAAVDLVSGAVDPLCLPSSGGSFRLGATIVACTARDRAGNHASVTFTVNVVDTTPPFVAPHADVFQTATSAAGATVT